MRADHSSPSRIASRPILYPKPAIGPVRDEALGDAAAEARRLHRLADDLLLLSTLDADRAPAREEVDLAALAADHLADRGRVGQITFRLHAPGPAAVRGDAEKLGRLLTNLLDNAERHARTGVAVTVTRDTDEVVLDVSDDGPGVPIEHRDRVFDRFARLDEARDRHDGGTGLGLAIARDICVRHGGTLTVSEADSGGARFVARLPGTGPAPARTSTES